MELIKVLKQNGFRLGGSRRMAEKFPDKIQVGPETDWDLYGEDSEENRACLASLGFAVVDAPNRDYWDNLLVDMFQHPDHHVQVLLRSDVECYTAAFESIDAETFINWLWKSSPKRDSRLSRHHFSAIVCDHFNRLFDGFRMKRVDSFKLIT
jgi:hypothetical protein